MIPRISLRTVILMVSAMGVLTPILVLAIKGNVWGMAVGLGLLSFLVMFVVYALLYSVAALFLFGRGKVKQVASPFAEQQLPPQLVAPESPNID
jgi:hypothetical protein